MKKTYKIVACMSFAAACMPSANAQQLENPGFEGEWGACVPWTFYITDDEAVYGKESAVEVGTQPAGWCISNVTGMASYYEGEATGLGSTVVGEKVEGFESEAGVKLTNTANPFMASQIVPAYITLGTSWSTANPTFSLTGIEIKNADGGSFGGIQYTGRPEGIEFMYRNRTEDAVKSTVVAYLWKGHWTQKDVPAVVYMTGEPVVKDMTDRDRCVLGMDMTGLQGGEVSKTDDAELIAVLTGEITEVSADWKKFSGKFEYKSDATPEMLNIIISAGDYFAPASDVKEGNTLTVDDVKLLYAQGAAETFPGYLNVSMGGENITVDQPSSLEITSTGEGLCTILLPNLVLEMGGSPLALGDIKVENVKVTEEGGVVNYEGSVKDMQLLGGMIVADVNLKGTNENGKLKMNIDVMWGETPVYVTFTSSPSAVSALEVEAAETAYYTLQGVRVDADRLAPGIYVKRQGNKAVRVLVK